MKPFSVSLALIVLACSAIAAPQKQIDVASVVTKADAESVLGEPVNEPQPRNGEESDGYYSRCNYYGQNDRRSLVLRVHQVNGGKAEARKEFQMLSSGPAKLKRLENLGDRAALSTTAAPNGTARTLMLYVAQGNTLITIGLAGLDDENVALQSARALAKKILKQL